MNGKESRWLTDLCSQDSPVGCLVPVSSERKEGLCDCADAGTLVAGPGGEACRYSPRGARRARMVPAQRLRKDFLHSF